MDGAVALAAGRQQPLTVAVVDAEGVEQKRYGRDLLSALQQRAHIVEAGERRCVQHDVGVHCQNLGDIGRGGDADRAPADQCADVDTIFEIGVHPRPNKLEVGPVIENSVDHLGAYGARRPLDDSKPSGTSSHFLYSLPVPSGPLDSRRPIR